MTRTHQVLFASIIIGAAMALAACGGGNEAPAATATRAAASPTVRPATATTAPSTSTPSPPPVDPCTLRTSLEGRPLSPGPSFALDADTEWQLCIGGAAAGSSEKYLFRTTDSGTTWMLISRTTLGNPTPEAGVGDLPNGNAVSQILFLDDMQGWMGLTSPGVNLWRSQDGGVNWTEVPVIPPGVPVTSITFTDAMHGTVVTPEGTWTTTDGGVTWTH
jgi:photosystem II stability/assembly factor-like uncharacterized protein